MGRKKEGKKYPEPGIAKRIETGTEYKIKCMLQFCPKNYTIFGTRRGEYENKFYTKNRRKNR